ncbi:hypothetical protein F2Q70_00024386 [Brassica cretica]|uniref:K+ potassium transporter integral membrane domain-containing protein n=1 Tax=Brassica cretica TaxID=69181 RepID=A0A8S9LDG5_BRACR|nr:hypothetical protein F2Q70_00024386 [Brassica cretica]
MDLNFGKCCGSKKKESWRSVLLLAYQSLGVVYGDLSISPLYVFKSTFAEDIRHSETNEEIYGVLSFVFWTLTLLPLLKYVFIVLRADDNGEGGTFALYSLICRHVKVSLLPNRQAADEALSTYKLEHPPEKIHDSCVKRYLEKHKWLHTALLILVLLGTCNFIDLGCRLRLLRKNMRNSGNPRSGGSQNLCSDYYGQDGETRRLSDGRRFEELERQRTNIF